MLRDLRCLVFRRRDTGSTEKAWLRPTRQRDKNASPPPLFFPLFDLAFRMQKAVACQHKVRVREISGVASRLIISRCSKRKGVVACVHKVLITSKGSCGYHGSENGRSAKGCLLYFFCIYVRGNKGAHWVGWLNPSFFFLFLQP